MPDVRLVVNGTEYGGWESIRIERGMEQAAGSFDLAVSERWPGQDTARPILPGDACTVTIDGETVITGYVDDFAPSYDARSHSVSIKGRDKTGDLVDCSAVFKTGHWINAKLEQIATDVAKPFGIGVAVEADTGKAFTEFAIQEGETAFELLERAARQRAVLLTADGMGNLVITRAGTAGVDVALEKGQNILAASGTFSHKDRHSQYIVKGQRRGTDDDIDAPEAITQVAASATDSGVSRYRPLIVLAEDMGDGATYQQRVDWERNTRLGKSIRTSITVQGWRTTEGGALWQPNRRVQVRDDWQGLDTELLIAKVSFSLGQDGTKTVLELTHPTAYDTAPLKSKKKKNQGAGEWL